MRTGGEEKDRLPGLAMFLRCRPILYIGMIADAINIFCIEVSIFV